MAKPRTNAGGPKKTYPVLDEIRHDGESYSPSGDRRTIDLTDAQAAPLLAVKAIGAAPPDTKAETGGGGES